MSDTLQFDSIASFAFNLGFDYGQTWFTLYLIVILGVFIYRIVTRL